MNGRDDTNWMEVGVWQPGKKDNQTKQNDMMMSPSDLIATALKAGISPKKTKIFQNLCDVKILEEWNEMQANPIIKILREKDIKPPKDSPVVIEAIRVDYFEVDSDRYNIALLIGIAIYKYAIENFMKELMMGTVYECINEVLSSPVTEIEGKVKTLLYKKYAHREPAKIDVKLFCKDMYNVAKEKEVVSPVVPGSKKHKQIIKKSFVYNKDDKPEIAGVDNTGEGVKLL